MRDWTPIIICVIPIGLGLLDVLLFWLGGNEATISWVMLVRRASQPIVGLSTCYSFGMLLTHFYLPSVGESPRPYQIVARLLVALSPTFYAIVIIAFDNGTLEAHRKVLAAGGSKTYALYMSAAVHFGGFVGWAVLPQHLAPEV